MYAEKNGEKYLVDFIRLPDQIYQVFYSVVDSKGQSVMWWASQSEVTLVGGKTNPADNIRAWRMSAVAELS